MRHNLRPGSVRVQLSSLFLFEISNCNHDKLKKVEEKRRGKRKGV